MSEFLIGTLPMLFDKDCQVLNLFKTMSTLGTPEDISLDGFRVKNLFLMDRATEIIFQTWAEPY